MTSFFTLRDDSGTSLRISTRDTLPFFPYMLLCINGTFGYTLCYCEWVEDVLSRCSSVLSAAHLEKAVQASLYVYDCSDDMAKAICEYWSPSTNTLLTDLGELSLSLWDLYKLGGFPVRGQILDEVVPSAECLSLALPNKYRIPDYGIRT
ncbi:hypothetical protein LIER_33664 [Lithospermum erythrorhizon]|uniref:Aminotransferase-like plant mobile domain-containing protein n=1 Tax=Lithospermum erythrorhizon TaxID=34254 RepID=A0AAV3S1X8_LITER